MNYNYSRYRLSKKEKKLERFFEIIPGMLSLIIIIGMSVISFLNPLVAAVIIIAFLLYWLLRMLYMNIFLVLSYARLAIEKDAHWMKRTGDVDASNLDMFCEIKKYSGIKNKISAFIHCRQLQKIENTDKPPESKDIYHLVIITVIRESRDVVEPGILSIKNGDYPSQRILLLIALEENAAQDIKDSVFALQKEYRDYFLDLIVSVHPNNIPNEARVKGANATYAAQKAVEYFKNKNIPYENVIVSCFDADTVPRENYFSCLTYHFMVTPQRTKASYQPIPIYYNNVWNVPSFARIIDIGTSFFQLVEATNPSKLITFSSHSMSFKALVDVGFWPVDMISDDSAIFWKAFIHYDGNYRVVPMYTTVSMDIATGKNIWGTFSSIYKQKRRWAWGVENFPIVMRAFLKSKRISFYKKARYGFKLLDSFVSWATWSFLLAFVCWLPALFAGREFISSTVYYTAPRIRGTIFILASIGIFVCMIISLLLLPAKDKKNIFLIKLAHMFEWLLIPIIVLVLSALPALDAQMRLLFGKYMEFWVTEKYRNKKE